MRLPTPDPTPMRAAFPAAVLRGGAVDGSRDASPLGSGSGAPGGKVDGRLTSARLEGRIIAQRPSGPAAQRPSGPAAQRPSGPAA